MTTISEDPRLILLEKVNLDASRVEYTDNHIVLLCGGKVNYKDRSDDPTPAVASLRHAITHAGPQYETYRPEDITDWHADGMFRNLMDFEQELAGICSLVAVILESPGAIAELGAFSQLPELHKKIVAIKSLDFENPKAATSFINLGILRYIREQSNSAVRNYPWRIDNPSSITEEVVSDVIADLQEELDKTPKSLVFKKEINSHKLSLICELISLFTALKETEIFDFLNSLGVSIEKDELRRKLFLLDRFKLITKKTYSDATFYLSGKYQYHRLRLALTDGLRHDAIRTQADCIAFYRTNSKQRNRIRAIQQSSGPIAI
ncbi:retron St85 family effector protein [Duganella radicis]|uniref:Uncharacterized protein n=1 Tax=Duganella radicis TaxID=551988 RepID=A0A6L6PPK2_9BURK|nr:hypothetical protein [Duganella radicis]